ncbi:MAG: hypothetical protein HY883_00605 [Deltaproteobacteria bacterium]|nr:hypothetical protein [Deltaproteobacteria bacterium]
MDLGISVNMIMALAIFFVLALGTLTILWLVMPFSVFAIKDALKELREEARKTNMLLEALLEETSAIKKMKKTEGEEKPPEHNT